MFCTVVKTSASFAHAGGSVDGNSRLDCSGVCAGDVPHSVVLPFLLLHRCRAYRLSAHAGRTDSPSAACERTFWRLVCSAGSGPGYRAHSRADHLDRKAMVLIGAGRQCVHAPMIPHLQVAEPAVWLT